MLKIVFLAFSLVVLCQNRFSQPITTTNPIEVNDTEIKNGGSISYVFDNSKKPFDKQDIKLIAGDGGDGEIDAAKAQDEADDGTPGDHPIVLVNDVKKPIS